MIAVDIPSGISSETGQVMGCAVKCDETRTFAFRKRGHLLYPGCMYAGRCHLSQIGITPRSFDGLPGMFSMTTERAPDLLPPRNPNGNKGTFGKVLILAGRRNMCGAALLCARACMASGAGMVRIFTHDSNREIIQQTLPEALLETYTETESPDSVFDKLRASLMWADIAAAGPAMGTDAAAARLLSGLLELIIDPAVRLRGLVLDADALRLLAGDPCVRKVFAASRAAGIPCILTPHMAEFAGLADCSLKECRQNTAALLQQQADLLHASIICKDARTMAAAPSFSGQGVFYLNTSGNSGMATAGSGDVLTGMTAAFLAVMTDPAKEPPMDPPAAFQREGGVCMDHVFSRQRVSEGFDAACTAAWLHGLAGDMARDIHGEQGMTAGDLITVLRTAAFWR